MALVAHVEASITADARARIRRGVQSGQKVGLFGIPFVAAVDFRRYTYVWCKDNPAGNVAETGLAFVRLARACIAARGKAFGTGYVESP